MEPVENLRLYHRFTFSNPKICFVSLSPNLTAPVKTLSYGGLSVITNSQPTSNVRKIDKSNKQTLNIELHFLDKKISCLVEERYSIVGEVGYQFSHEQTHILNFLKEIIPWMRAGAALAFLQKSERDGFEGELPEHLSFEGPIPFEIEWTGLDTNKVPNFLLSFGQDKVSYQLERKNGQLTTLHNVWPGAESGELRPTLGLDSNILRLGLAIFVGLSQDEENPNYNNILNVLLELYQKEKAKSETFLRQKTG